MRLPFAPVVAICGALLTAAGPAPAHFVYVVAEPGNKSVRVVFSDSLEPDEDVDINKVAGLKLTARGADGKDEEVEVKPGEHRLTGDLGKSSAKVVFGHVNYGLMTRAAAKPALLVYHPKLVMSGADEKLATLGKDEPVELVPVVAGGKVAFKVLAAGKPVAETEVAVLGPDGAKHKLKTDAKGVTTPLPGTGKFAAWAKVAEAKAGEHDGKKYEEVRHYGTLVVDVSGPARPPLPKAASSLGAVVADGYLYVYGGHAGKTHTYSTEDMLGTFHRLKLDGGTAWEELPGGPKLQGVNLAAHDGKVIRVGGMTARNAPGEPGDTLSVADGARFDPKANKWEPLPALPAGRSSHDLVVSGDTLVAVGGWELRGKGNEPAWHDTTVVLDLSRPGAAWESVPQPFERRALTAAAAGGRVVVVAGLDADAKPQPRVDIFDVRARAWTRGPDLPGSKTVGFSPAAAVVDGSVVVSASDARLHRLTGDKWEAVGSSESRRKVHRLVPAAGGVLLVGGATVGGPAAELEFVAVKGK